MPAVRFIMVFFAAISLLPGCRPADGAAKPRALVPGVYRTTDGGETRMYCSVGDRGVMPRITIVINDARQYGGTAARGAAPGSYTLEAALEHTADFTRPAALARRVVITPTAAGIELAAGSTRRSLSPVSLWDIAYESMGAPGDRPDLLFGGGYWPSREYLLLRPARDGSVTADHCSRAGLARYRAADWRVVLETPRRGVAQNGVPQQALRLRCVLEGETDAPLSMAIDFFRSPVTDLGALVTGRGGAARRFWQANDSNVMRQCVCPGGPAGARCERLYVFILPKDSAKLPGDREVLLLRQDVPVAGIFRYDSSGGVLYGLGGQRAGTLVYHGDDARATMTLSDGKKKEYSAAACDGTGW